ncbi:hypothetical protein [Actinomadura decatromicini]|uniref:Uncharacterized protein n=1 Tax=Actinomadura decatromicini TaxID=2604572 RepID=A0A5D3FFR7_9ACTN|nr:hypothetical protein [Actinomadura decatromicini]TYK46808.1 hypothetical protein FXF68_23510 [Actinomadura decatromicini]
MQKFEERLLAELKDVVAAQTASATANSHARSVRWRWAGLVTAAAATAAGLAIGIPVLTGDQAPQANAVVRDPDGSIRIYIRDYRHPEIIASRLRGLGVPAVVDFVPNDKRCRTPRGAITPNDGSLVTVEPEQDDSQGSYSRLHPDRMGPGKTLVLEVSFTSFSEDESVAWMFVGTATGHVGPCVLVPAPPKMTRGPDGGVGG